MRTWPVDAANPGEVLACAGIAHLAWRADSEAATGFVRGRDGALRFAAPDAALTQGEDAWTLESLEGPPHERLRLAGVTLDWWCAWGLNPRLKTWAGQQSARTVHRNLHRALGRSRASDWLRHTAPVPGGRLSLDPRSAWDALELGWSPAAHRSMRVAVRPWVELLASLGLQAFPLPGRRAPGGFRYRLWRVSPLAVARAAFTAQAPTVETLGAFQVPTARSGANTVLRPAAPDDGDPPEHGDPL